MRVPFPCGAAETGPGVSIFGIEEGEAVADSAGMLNQRVQVRVPGTSANLGPGYDCLGMAVGLYNVLTLDRTDGGTHQPMVDQAAGAFFATTRMEPFPFSWRIAGDVPRSRGLGSSVTVRLGLLQGLNELCGGPLDREGVFRMCAALEGHPDNAAPATYGGFTVARRDGQISRFEIDPDLRIVLLIPNFEMETVAARKVLPTEIAVADAVTALGNACAITAAFASQDYQMLRGAFHDTIHQPYRTRLIPFLPAVIAAAEAAGALGGFLSGSGSTIAALTLDHPPRVARAMAEAAGLSIEQTRIFGPDNHGVATLDPEI